MRYSEQLNNFISGSKDIDVNFHFEERSRCDGTSKGATHDHKFVRNWRLFFPRSLPTLSSYRRECCLYGCITPPLQLCSLTSTQFFVLPSYNIFFPLLLQLTVSVDISCIIYINTRRSSKFEGSVKRNNGHLIPFPPRLVAPWNN